MYKTILLSIIIFALSFQSAFAYIDPGSGSAIMSIIIGIFVSIGVIIKTFWYKIKSLLGLLKSDKTTDKDNLK